ncbi:unnamed protein product [Linum trigynum]|uniref:CCHC-type domain-containing protein n=1 Tax=Linum trigynum TaxID=586398 RepID=A0AAV2GP71_9ROSI
MGKPIYWTFVACWRFYLPSPEEADTVTQEEQIQTYPLQGQITLAQTRVSGSATPNCELRSRNGASSEFRSRNGTNPIQIDTKALIKNIRRRPSPELCASTFLRPDFSPKRARVGMVAGSRRISGIALFSETFNCHGDFLFRRIFTGFGTPTKRLSKLDCQSSPLPLELSYQEKFQTYLAYIKQPPSLMSLHQNYRDEEWVPSSCGYNNKQEEYSGKWELCNSAIFLSVWVGDFPTRTFSFNLSSYPWGPVSEASAIVTSCELKLSSLLQSATMARIASDQVVEFSLTEVQSDRVRQSRMLLGRLFTEDRLTPIALRAAINNPWQGQGRIIVREAAQGLYEFILPTEAAKNWVLQRTPWVINDKILHLRAWTPNITTRTFDEMATAPFRVQMWDVREECCTQQFGRKIASSTLGRVLEAGIFSCTDTTNTFIKVKTLIDFSKPLRSQIWATNEETGSFWIRFKYEHLPSFCYNCGRVGHFRQNCMFDPPARKERFGPHMTTKKMGRKIFEEDDQMPRFSGHPNSVWINSNVRQKTGQDDREIRRTMPRQDPIPRKPRAVDDSPLWMGSSDSPFITTEEAEQRAKMGRSPLKFPIPKAAPKVNLGRQVRRGKGKVTAGGSPMEIDENRALNLVPRRRRRNGRSTRNDQGTAPTAALERKVKSTTRRTLPPDADGPPLKETDDVSRRRRLILENESEEEFVVRPVSSTRPEDDRPPIRQPVPCGFPAPQLSQSLTVPPSKATGKKKGESVRPGSSKTNGPAQDLQRPSACLTDPKARGKMGKSTGGLTGSRKPKKLTLAEPDEYAQACETGQADGAALELPPSPKSPPYSRPMARPAGQRKLRSLAAKEVESRPAVGQGRNPGKKAPNGGSQPSGTKGTKDAAVAQEAPPSVAAPPIPSAIDDTIIGLVDSESEEDLHPFELRRRQSSTVKELQRLAQSSRVNNVVQAFETGLAMADPEPIGNEISNVESKGLGMEKIGEGAINFDEYGSNLVDPKEGGRKRQIEALEGEIAASPTPKRQFIEEDADLKSVEEASRKWPQPDK